jgi:hypothetical protein
MDSYLWIFLILPLLGCGLAGEKDDRMFLLKENTCEKGTRSAIHFLLNCKFVLELLG